MSILPPQAWTDENTWIDGDEEIESLLESLECPDHLERLELWDEEVWGAFCKVLEEGLLFHLEQSCDSSGRLLSDDIRETKLQNGPIEELRSLEKFIRETDCDVLAQVAYFTFWLVRFERASRTGAPDLRI